VKKAKAAAKKKGTLQKLIVAKVVPAVINNYY
jgi:hypothetical protein